MDPLLVLVIAVVLFLLWINYKTLTDVLSKKDSGRDSVIVDSSYPYYNYPYYGYGSGYGYPYYHGRRRRPLRRWGGRRWGGGGRRWGGGRRGRR